MRVNQIICDGCATVIGEGPDKMMKSDGLGWIELGARYVRWHQVDRPEARPIWAGRPPEELTFCSYWCIGTWAQRNVPPVSTTEP